jgi:hypothetical protein
LDLDQLAAVDPELAVRRWEDVKDEAHAELESGHRAAMTMESYQEKCWRRAQFLALREELAEQWQPQNGIERTLIDMMAQAWTAQMFWTERLISLDAIEAPEQPQGTKVQLPRMSAAAAMDQAAGMVDRCNRIFMRALRQLRDLRRYAPAIIVRHAQQVNVGEQQVNVGGEVTASSIGDGLGKGACG